MQTNERKSNSVAEVQKYGSNAPSEMTELLLSIQAAVYDRFWCRLPYAQIGKIIRLLSQSKFIFVTTRNVRLLDQRIRHQLNVPTVCLLRSQWQLLLECVYRLEDEDIPMPEEEFISLCDRLFHDPLVPPLVPYFVQRAVDQWARCLEAPDLSRQARTRLCVESERWIGLLHVLACRVYKPTTASSSSSTKKHKAAAEELQSLSAQPDIIWISYSHQVLRGLIQWITTSHTHAAYGGSQATWELETQQHLTRVRAVRAQTVRLLATILEQIGLLQSELVQHTLQELLAAASAFRRCKWVVKPTRTADNNAHAGIQLMSHDESNKAESTPEAPITFVQAQRLLTHVDRLLSIWHALLACRSVRFVNERKLEISGADFIRHHIHPMNDILRQATLQLTVRCAMLREEAQMHWYAQYADMLLQLSSQTTSPSHRWAALTIDVLRARMNKTVRATPPAVDDSMTPSDTITTTTTTTATPTTVAATSTTTPTAESERPTSTTTVYMDQNNNNNNKHNNNNNNNNLNNTMDATALSEASVSNSV